MQIGPSEGTRDVHICISKFHCQLISNTLKVINKRDIKCNNLWWIFFIFKVIISKEIKPCFVGKESKNYFELWDS